MRSLIVEDDNDVTFILEEILKNFGECTFARNGKEAFDAYKKAMNAGNPFTLVCLDIMMPKMDGREVLRKIRTYEDDHDIRGASRVKVFMTTALNDADSVLGSFREGCEAYLVKPYKKDSVVAQLQKFELIK